MYTRATSLPKLYIRNIIPDDMDIPVWSAWPYRGGAKRPFSTYVEEEFSEVRAYSGFQRYWTYRHSVGGVRSFAPSGVEGRLFQLFTAARYRRTG